MRVGLWCTGVKTVPNAPWLQHVKLETIRFLSFLNVFGCSRTPTLDFDGHCGSTGSPCNALQSEIATCQGKGVKVILSLGGPSEGTYSLCSTFDAQQVANYLYANFLSGRVTLDGINLNSGTGSSLYWENLVEYLYNFSTTKGSKAFSLSASPQCFLPDPYLDNAIKTAHLDYIIVQFYNDPSCQYSCQVGALLTSWNAWTSNVPQDSKIFLGILASPTAANGGG